MVTEPVANPWKSDDLKTASVHHVQMDLAKWALDMLAGAVALGQHHYTTQLHNTLQPTHTSHPTDAG